MSTDLEQTAQDAEEPKRAVLEIVLEADGTLSFSAPGNGQFYNEMLCFYMLKKAEQQIMMHNTKVALMNKNKIVQPKNGILNFARNRFK